MATEIERKFLVVDDSWNFGVIGTRYQQGYLSVGPGPSVRVRLAGDQAWLTIKGHTQGFTRLEFEYPIPVEDARELLPLCLSGMISKTRYRVDVSGHSWEIDVFDGDNAGLVIAEIELQDEQEAFAKPAWLGREVTGEARYYNASLSQNPYCNWKDLP
jgi:adenylate cyclase